MEKIFRVEDLDFEIHSSKLTALISDRYQCLCWDVEINAVEKVPHEYPMEPKVETEQFIRTKPGEVKRWQDLVGRKVIWKEQFDENKVDCTARMYIYSHENIHHSTFQLLQEPADRVWLDWSGQVNLYFDDSNRAKYWENVPFRIVTELEFEGILCGRRPEQECWDRLRPYLPREHFKYHKTEHGVSVLVPA